MKNKIPRFTKPELDYLIENCNFTDRELQLFHLRNKDVTLEACADIMNMSVSTVKRTSKEMIKKIVRVI